MLRSHAHANTAGPLALSRRRLDFRGNNLHGPHAVAHLAADETHDLTALLRALAGIADDFHNMLVHLARTLAGLFDNVVIHGRCHGGAGGLPGRGRTKRFNLAAEVLDCGPPRFAGGFDVLGMQ